MSKKGYVKFYRSIIDSVVWTDSRKLKLWTLCLCEATHKGLKQMVGNQVVDLLPGQFITGRNDLEEMFNKGIKKTKNSKNSNSQFVEGQTLYRWLELFEEMEMLNIKKTNKYSVITVLNWNKYQGDLTTDEQQLNNSLTSDEQQINTNKNDKNVNNISLYINNACAREIFNTFEEEFKRPLSSNELIKLSDFINKFGEEKTIEALRKASIYQKLNFDYINRILENGEQEDDY